jgi:Lon protease-like protein
MSDDLPTPQNFDGTVRLFPLPNVVLFPHVMLPLHIFESRYRQMTAEALAGDHLIALVLLQPGWESDYEGCPALHRVACLGRIVADQRLEDGRYNILVRGLSRIRLLQELDNDKLYRTARVELLNDTAVPAADQVQALRAEVARLGSQWFSRLGLASEEASSLLMSDVPVGTLCDILTSAFPLTMEFKQEILAELDVERRIRRLLHHLETNEPPKVVKTSSHKYPPDFSDN